MAFIDKITSDFNTLTHSDGYEAVRKEAFETFAKSGLPTNKNEEWKYTSLRKYSQLVFEQSQSATITKDQLQNIVLNKVEGYTLVVVNGVFQPELSDLIDEKGVQVSSLKQAIADNAEGVEKYLFKLNTDADKSLSSLNKAFSEDGIYVHVAKSATLTKPIKVYFVNQSQNAPVLAQPHNLYVFEENSEGCVIEKFDTIGTDGLTNIVSEIVVAESARADYYKIQGDVDTSRHIGTTEVYQAGKSIFSSNTISISGELIRNNLNVKLEGEHSETYMNGLYMLEKSTHVDNHTLVDHTAPHCYSDEMYKGIMDGESNGVFNGKVFVRQAAQKTNAFQSNRNILLSDDAKINTKPQLEIWADDVKCTHGATTGQIDEDALYYLKARGIRHQKAMGLMLNAFAAEVTERFKNKEIASYVQDLIENRLS